MAIVLEIASELHRTGRERWQPRETGRLHRRADGRHPFNISAFASHFSGEPAFIVRRHESLNFHLRSSADSKETVLKSALDHNL
jgi:hypothetical protein